LSKVIQKSGGAEVAEANASSAASAGQAVLGFEPRRIRIQPRRPPPGANAPNSPPHLLPTGQEGEETIDVEAIQREAFRHGHEEGERAGLEKATATYREAVAAFGRSALQVATFKPRLRREAEQELVELAFAIARKIVRREVSVDPAVIVGLVQGCLEQYNRAEISRLQVHPQDFATVSEFFQQNPSRQIEVVADSKVSRGGVVFQTSRGTLDARFETQLEEIEKGLTDR
jgi:flagellar assembly protein FliH